MLFIEVKAAVFITSLPLINKKSRPHIRKKPAIIQKIRIGYAYINIF